MNSILRATLAALCEPLPEQGLPLLLDGQRMGWLAAERVALACEVLPELSAGSALEWRSAGRGSDALSKVIGLAARRLRERGAVTGWRDELYRCEGAPLRAEPGPAWFDLERAAFRFFGLRSRAVHVSGWTAGGHLIAGRRAMHKATDPGTLDNLAAGGLGAKELPQECARRELWEEAGVEAALSKGLQELGLLHSRRVEPEGLHDELLHIYRLRLPEDFVPRNGDGEVSEFLVLEPAQAVARLAEFSRDAAAVLACDLLAGIGF